MKRVLILVALLACRPQPRSWIERSNENAQVLLDVQAKFAPEQAARQGVSGIDDRIADYTPGHRERYRAALKDALAKLQGRREDDPLVAQDLEILIKAA